MIGIVTVALFLPLISSFCLGLSDRDLEMLIERVHALEIKEERLQEECKAKSLQFEEKSLQFETKSRQIEAEIARLEGEVRRQNRKIEDLKMILESRGHTEDDIDRDESTAVPDKPTTHDTPTKESSHGETKEPGGSDELGLLVKKSVGIQEGPVAFHATTDIGILTYFNRGQHIILDLILLNIGGGYHEHQGAFITPKNGIYLFSVSVLSDLKPHSEIQFQIMKDGIPLGCTYANGDESLDQGSISVVTQLNTGDEVWVELLYSTTNTYFRGGRFTSFSGCLITEM